MQWPHTRNTGLAETVGESDAEMENSSPQATHADPEEGEGLVSRAAVL